MSDSETKHRRFIYRTRYTGLSLIILVVGFAAPAVASPVEMTPQSVSTGIQDPLASINVALTASSVEPGAEFLEYTVEAFFVDTCCDYLLDFEFPDAIVSDVETEVLTSPAGGTAAWNNPSATPVDLATANLTCSVTPEDNFCSYRVRLSVDLIPLTGTIQDIPVEYAEIPSVPLMAPWSYGLLALIVGAGSLRRLRRVAARNARR